MNKLGKPVLFLVILTLFSRHFKDVNALSFHFQELSLLREPPYDKFNGNACRKLLKNIDLLEKIVSECKPQHTKRRLLQYVKTFRVFNDVVSTCFGKNLLPGWEKNIQQFEVEYAKLKTFKGKPVSVTSKVHICARHVPEYCKRTGRGLGFDCEQAVETSHSFFAKFVENRRLVGKGKPNRPQEMKGTLCAWNSQHM